MTPAAKTRSPVQITPTLAIDADKVAALGLEKAVMPEGTWLTVYAVLITGATVPLWHAAAAWPSEVDREEARATTEYARLRDLLWPEGVTDPIADNEVLLHPRAEGERIIEALGLRDSGGSS